MSAQLITIAMKDFEALRADKERLDWLSEHPNKAWLLDDCAPVRAAIDGAMREAGIPQHS